MFVFEKIYMPGGMVIAAAPAATAASTSPCSFIALAPTGGGTEGTARAPARRVRKTTAAAFILARSVSADRAEDQQPAIYLYLQDE